MAIPELNRPPRAQGLILVYGEGKLETRETPSTQSARAGPASPSLGPETRLCRLPGRELPAGTPRQASGGLPSQRARADPLGPPPGASAHAGARASSPPRVDSTTYTRSRKQVPVTDAETALRAGLGCSTASHLRRGKTHD